MNFLTIMQDGKKQILSTTKGNQLISGLKIKTESDSYIIRLYDTNAKNATNTRCKLNGKTYAFGTTSKCLFSVSLVGVDDSLRNRSYIFEINDKKINLLTTFKTGTTGLFFIPDFHLYCFSHFYWHNQAWKDRYIDFSFDGVQWFGFSFQNSAYISVAENALLLYRRVYVDDIFDTIEFYVLKDETIALSKTFTDIDFFKDSYTATETFLGFNTELELFFYNSRYTTTGTMYFKRYYSDGKWNLEYISKEAAITVQEYNINLTLSIEDTPSGFVTDCFTGETVEINANDNTGEIIATGNDWTDTYILDYIKNYRKKSIKILSVSATFDKQMSSGKTIIFDKIQGGIFNINFFYDVLSEFITENSYRVVANDFSITDGNFTIDIKTGQKIWLCVEGSSPNFAKTIRFVLADNDSDYSGSIQQYVSGYENYNFYGNGSTGFANAYKYKGRDNNYYSITSYDVTITDIFFK